MQTCPPRLLFHQCHSILPLIVNYYCRDLDGIAQSNRIYLRNIDRDKLGEGYANTTRLAVSRSLGSCIPGSASHRDLKRNKQKDSSIVPPASLPIIACPDSFSLFFLVEPSYRIFLILSSSPRCITIDQYSLSGSPGRTVHSRARDRGAKLTYLLFQGYHHRHLLLFFNLVDKAASKYTRLKDLQRRATINALISQTYVLPTN